MSKDKYPSIFLRQMEAIVLYSANGGEQSRILVNGHHFSLALIWIRRN